MKNLDLGKEKINKLLLAFTIPCIISMLVNSIYNIVDQIFIGKGVGSLGNAATNVIFPIVIICNAIAQLIGNGCAANLSLLLGQGKKEEAKNAVGSSISLLFISSILVTIIGEVFLPKLVYLFGCTPNAYDYSITYGRIILIGAPFMIVYTGLSAIIRSDGSPKYSMICLLSGAIANIILDPIFIFGFNMGVAGGALATIIGQVISFIIAVIYLFRMKNFKLEKNDYKMDKSIFRTLGYGMSSFIIQMTILALFIVMNNVMNKYGKISIYGEDIPLSVYGVVSKLNSLYVSLILGVAIGAQPILGFNYGAGNTLRAKEVIKKVLVIGFIIGIVFNLILQLIPGVLINLFATKSDNNYELFMEFGVKCCRIFLMVCALNAFEMCSSILLQSLGSVRKASFVSFLRQIILFIPLCLILSSKIGLFGALYAGPIADSICFIIVIFIFFSEYKKISTNTSDVVVNEKNVVNNKLEKKIVITISREYGSGGHYIGKLVSEKLSISFYDKELIRMVSDETGLSIDYVNKNDQKKNLSSSYNPFYNNDDAIFLAESKVIKNLAKKSCVIVGRCSDYILKDQKDVLRIFIYNGIENKIDRCIKYYKLDKSNAKKEINKINKARAEHYKYYTSRNWSDPINYDLCINTDNMTVEEAAELIKNIATN